MTIFDELEIIYGEIDDAYLKMESFARARRFKRKEAEYSRKRQLNDQSYFLFMFTRLEDRLRTLSENLFRTYSIR